MSEKDAASTCTQLSVTEAAARVGVSEKTLRKRIARGEVEAERETLAGGGWAWRVAADSIEKPERLEDERLEVPTGSNRVTEALGSGNQAQNPAERLEVPTASKRVTESATEVPTAHLPSVPSASNEAALLREALTSERENVAFLRLQLEAANRSNAEISAALREALKMSHRALTSGAAGVPSDADTCGPQVLAAPENQNQSAPQVLAEASQNAPERADGPQIGAAGKVTGQGQSGRNSGAGRGFRQWLLKVLRG